MVENITVVDLNGNSIVAEKISFVKLNIKDEQPSNPSNGKTYAFYTLNEVDEHGLSKIYIAEANTQAGISMPIDDKAYNAIRKAMVDITTNQSTNTFEYLPTNGQTFYVGLQKKLIIKPEKVEMLKNDYNNKIVQATAETNTQEETFDVFDNASDVTSSIPETSSVSSVIPDAPSIEPPVETVATSNQPVIDPTLVQNQPDTQVFNNQPGALQNNAFDPNLSLESNPTPNDSPRAEVTYDKAVEALNTLNRYFQQTKTLPSSLAENINSNNDFISSQPMPVDQDIRLDKTASTQDGVFQDSLAFKPEGLTSDQVSTQNSIDAPISMNDLNALDNLDSNQGFNSAPAVDTNQGAMNQVVMPTGFNGGIDLSGSGMVTPNTLNLNNQNPM